ncbi:MAG: alpha/beta hydrolase-fold protein [Thermoanaerobaculia bacterium]|nr:alpha/beta hydrolase-fold protein [Thermoanaerobaculia bacterium]
MHRKRLLLALTLAVATFSLGPARPAAATEPEHSGRLLAVEVHGPSLENNLLGFSTRRDVRIYLPPSYDDATGRRYPTLYVLHGITDPVTVWTETWSGVEEGWGTLQDLMDRGIASGRLEEMILVMLDGRTPFFGSHYANSSVKGNWQDYIAEDLVAWVDSQYRTLAAAPSRGVMGHSMGGHGAIRLGLDRPDVFRVVYGLSPSLLGWGGDVSADNPAFELLLSDDPSQHFDTNFYVVAAIGVSQAFSPNPDRPPYFADYPFRLEGGALVPDPQAHARWEANFPANRIEAYLSQPHRLVGLRFDSAFRDEFTHIPPTSRAFSEALTAKGVEHRFEMFNGDHRNRLWGPRGRLATEVLPYFSQLLERD